MRLRSVVAGLLTAALLAPIFGFVSLNAFQWYQGIQAYNERGRGLVERDARGNSAVSPSRSLFFNPDAYLWNRLALEVAEGKSLRVRHTTMDNYPAGREVHWHSGLLWLIAAAGWTWRLVSREDLQLSLEKASLLVNPMLAVALATVTLVVIRRRAGLPAAAVVLFALFGSPAARAFQAGGVDHHGLLVASAFLSVVFLLLGGAGWTRGPRGGHECFLLEPASARVWFVASAVAGGIGLWVSAFSQIGVLAGIFVGGCLTVPWLRPENEDVSYAPELWRTWGLTGLLTSLAFYLLEYFPNHMGLRLEVNHPLYGLAWWGGAELLASVMEWRLGSRPWASVRARLRSAAAVAAVLAVPVVIGIGRSRVMLPLDPMLWRLHEIIFEFTPLPFPMFVRSFAVLLGAVALAVFSVILRRSRTLAALTLFASGCAMVAPLTLLQSRWFAPSAAILAAVLLPPAAHAFPGGRSRWCRHAATAGMLLVVVAGFVVNSRSELAAAGSVKEMERHPDPFLVNFFVVRDVADMVRAQQPGAPIVLSTFWPTLVFSYSSGGSGLGTLYWENRAGIEAALSIFTAGTEREALRLLREHGVTHILLLKDDSSIRKMLGLKNGVVRESAFENSFGYALANYPLPPWLERMPYQPLVFPFGDPGTFGVRLYRVKPGPAPGGPSP